MNKITICTCVWKRASVFKIWLDCWLSLDPKPLIVVTGSLNDECEQLALDSGCVYYRMPNKPVGAKWNTSHLEALNSEYYLTTASDDVMDQAMWTFYNSFEGERLCLSDLYFYDTQSKRVIYWAGYGKKSAYKGYPIGAHQLTRFDVMEKLNFKPFDDKGMAHEHYTERQLIKLGIKSVVVPMELTGGIAVDIKSKESYSPFMQYKNSVPLTLKEFVDKSPEFVNRIIL